MSNGDGDAAHRLPLRVAHGSARGVRVPAPGAGHHDLELHGRDGAVLGHGPLQGELGIGQLPPVAEVAHLPAARGLVRRGRGEVVSGRGVELGEHGGVAADVPARAVVREAHPHRERVHERLEALVRLEELLLRALAVQLREVGGHDADAGALGLREHGGRDVRRHGRAVGGPEHEALLDGLPPATEQEGPHRGGALGVHELEQGAADDLLGRPLHEFREPGVAEEDQPLEGRREHRLPHRLDDQP
jgi:hypothetical protein